MQGEEPERVARAQAFLAAMRPRIDRALDEALPPPGTWPARLGEAIRWSLFAGGKRLRPALVLAAAGAVGGEPDGALAFACAVEMLHTYSLIHDDLPAMDDDDLRRGRPTSHRVYGEAMAILAADALHTEAFGLIARQAPSAELARAWALELAQAAGVSGMVAGQVADLEAQGERATEDVLSRIHDAKTAVLMRAAVRGGALAGGASEADLSALSDFGLLLGRTFQILDDVLDATGHVAALGKTPGKDAATGKMTYVALEDVAAARERAHRLGTEALLRLASLPAPERLRDLTHYVLARTT